MGSSGGDGPRWDFHVSYAEADEGWARWIDWVLEGADFKVHLKARELVAGARAVQVLQEAIRLSRRTIVVLSSSYLASPRVQAHWQAAWDSDPAGTERALLPVRVEDVRAEGLLGGITYIDLVGLDAGTAGQRLLIDEVNASLTGRRARPSAPPPFPGSSPSLAAGPPFPGNGTRPPAGPSHPGGS
ncbi:hypothetical protein CC117_02400 [Parafrankia colletiae]|uniref:TIR domain-containing protein n=2 Tax=Parafrankia colletiae TaxID=573497 RepID=A0A1S1R0A5_9ACTN|nr:hypothetical protein CC117_02400 [Parafrankia colletiae]